MRFFKLLLILVTFLLSGLFISSNAQVKITDGAVLTLNANSLLELESVNKGLLIPRIAINSLIKADPLIATVPAGMLVYSTGGLVPDGFYYWNGNLWIRFGSNWFVKEKQTRQDNQYEVSQSGSFVTIAEVVAFLNVHMSGPSVVKLGGGTYHIAATQTINLPYPVTFEGSSFGESMIVADAAVSGSPLFICQTESYFKMLVFTGISTASGNDALRFTGAGTYHEVKDCVFDGFNKGVATSNNTDLWIFENDFENCTGAGIEIAAGSASGGRLRVSETDFVQCATGINLLSGISETISIINSTFYNTSSGTDIGIHPIYLNAYFT